MNGQTEGKLIYIGVVIIMILFVLGMSRLGAISPFIGYNDICNVEYGENWFYDNDDDNFGRTCIELDYISLEIINRTKINLTPREAVDKYCNVPGFWQLNKWGKECEWEEE